MPDTNPKRAERNAGAFANPAGIGGGIPVPMSTLSDEYRDEPTEPVESDRIPEPEPPGLVRRAVQGLARRLNR